MLCLCMRGGVNFKHIERMSKHRPKRKVTLGMTPEAVEHFFNNGGLFWIFDETE